MIDGWEEQLARERGRQLADLRLHWGEAYDIGWDGGEFVAVRRSGGATIFSLTAEGLYEAMQLDYSIVSRTCSGSYDHDDKHGG